MHSLITIIIPVYNLEYYIARCLDSVLAQTYSNLQVIVVNDGSKDNSLKIIKQYEERDSRIILIDKANEGVSAARNMGVDIAMGEYIMFIDGDDWIDTNMVETLYLLAVENNTDFVGGGFVFEELKSGRKRFSPIGFHPQVIEGKNILRNYLTGHYLWGSVWGGMYRRTFLNEYNLRFDKGIRYGEDVFFNLQVMSKANKVLVCENHFYHVLVRPSSVTRQTVHELDKEKKNPDVVKYLKMQNLWDEYKEDYKVWFVRFSNYTLYHLALKVNYADYSIFFKHYTSTTDYLMWNNWHIRTRMNARNHLISFIGKYPLLTWLVMYLPSLFGRKILA